MRECRVCGCTEWSACEPACWWVEWDLCSACAPQPESYRGVRALFNADLHTVDPSWAPREDWIVVDRLTIEHVRPVGER